MEEINRKNKFTSCDKYDYIAAVSCGMIGALIDLFFVGAPGDSKLGNWTDKQVDEMVIKFSKMNGWKPGANCKNEVGSAIGHLERNFKINYDQRHTKDVDELFKMSTKNHHMKSLAHSPDVVGLFFSIINQFCSTSTFLDDGKIITIDTENFELKGSNFVSKIFCGFANWIGHLMSDVAGSSGATTRGSGIVMPFYELLGLCDFGKFQVGKDRQDLATIAIRAFQEGYDARHGITMSIPVIITELSIRLIWVLRQKFQYKKEIKECIPTVKHEDLRLMLIVGNGTLCAVDGTEAAIIGIKEQNFLTFFCHLNLVGWTRLAILILKDIQLRYDIEFIENADFFFEKVFGKLSPEEKERIKEFTKLIIELKGYLDVTNTIKTSLKEQKLAEEERTRIEKECAEKIAIIKIKRHELSMFVDQYLTKYLTIFADGELLIDEGLSQNDSDKYIAGNVAIQDVLDYDVQFKSQDEFDELMLSDVDFKF